MNTIARAIEEARSQLLDLGRRNRLIHCSLKPSRSLIPVVNERSDDVFRILWREQRRMSFSASGQTVEDTATRPEAQDLLPLEDGGQEGGYTDHRLETPLPAKQLETLLLNAFRTAKTVEEEQGVSVLYLALGFLSWRESNDSAVERLAPLLLLPVEFKRSDIRARITLSARAEDLQTNLSLQELLRREFDLKLPDLEDGEDFAPGAYHAAVEEALARESSWRVERDMIALGFFSFAKFLLWRDLDTAAWPQPGALVEHGLTAQILGRAGDELDPLFKDDERLDDVLDPRNLCYVVDADASQAKVIEETRANRSFAVWGPPGTGKSQTIANIVATAAQAGKKVLFVAEKMVALEVVHRRLKEAGLNDLCLELHSRSANKAAMLAELKRTLEAPRTGAPDLREIEDLRACRDDLNREIEHLHRPLAPSGRTPYQLMGEIVRLRGEGAALPDFTAPEAAQWAQDRLQAAREAVCELSSLSAQFGAQHAHPWRGVGAHGLDSLELERLGLRLSALARMIEHAAKASAWAPATFSHGAAPLTLSCLESIAVAVATLARAPDLPASTLSSRALRDNLSRAAQLVDAVEHLARERAALADVAPEAAWDADLTEAGATLAARGGALFAFLDARVHSANALLRSVLCKAPPKRLADRIALIDRLTEARKRRDLVKAEDGFGARAFGELWRGALSDAEGLRRARAWVEQAAALSREDVFARVCEADAIAAARAGGAELSREIEQLRRALQALFDELEIRSEATFGLALGAIAFDELIARLTLWAVRPLGLAEWARLVRAHRCACDRGAQAVANRLADGRIAPEAAVPLWDFAVAEAQLRSAREQEPALRDFIGEDRERRIERFRALETRRRTLAAQEIRARHAEGLPSGRAGAMGVLNQQFQKKRGLAPIRKLMREAGPAVQRIKPVLLMSPLSVAQFLPPGVLQFDLLVIDEASQVRPEDALGAIARASQVIVVGDDKQLPPTNFFERQIQDDGDPDDEEHEEIEDEAARVRPKDMESILSLCKASMPERSLRTHYRSRHPSLIEVSNELFYDGRLYLAPSPDRGRAERGMKLNYVPSVYEPGQGKRTNLKEAEAVAQAVMAHANRWVAGESGAQATLMVAAFSTSQRDAIWAAIDKLRKDNPECESFFNHNPGEPFDVKNLENVQGDERDVVFVSVGYGPAEPGGKVGNQFGPVNKEGGARRLNVLFTRARERTEVFCSFDPESMDVSKVGQGPAVLRRYLRMAKTGLSGEAAELGREPDSHFEIAVAGALRRMGHDVVHQVGSAGFFVDLAIVDPANPNRFALGVECDGAPYHSAPWARERDRLRESILRANGWDIHRIWSTDWFNDRAREERRLEARVRRAIEEKAGRTGVPAAVSVSPDHGRGDPCERPIPQAVDQGDRKGRIKRAVSRLM